MQSDRDLLKQALSTLEGWANHGNWVWPDSALEQAKRNTTEAITALRERLAQPEQEFTTHEEGEDGWSDWVCPDPKGYLMKCCDCGLVHETQFGVVRYKSEAEREDCEKVDDPNLQAVFRMRRSEEWTPDDTAYRPGGLAQPEQEPVAWMQEMPIKGGEIRSVRLTTVEALARGEWMNPIPLYTTPPRREWVGLTGEELDLIARTAADLYDAALKSEAKLKEKNE